MPAFLRYTAAAGNPNIILEIYGVNREKECPQDVSEKYSVERVPTFIVMENDTELGRIIEFPQESFVMDFINIISRRTPSKY